MFVSSCRSFVNGLSFVANDSPDTHVCASVCVFVCPQVWVPDERSMTYKVNAVVSPYLLSVSAVDFDKMLPDLLFNMYKAS